MTGTLTPTRQRSTDRVGKLQQKKGASAIATIGTLMVNVSANISGLQKGLNDARGLLVGLAGAVGVAFSADAFKHFIQGQADAVDGLGKMADRLGVTTEEMAAFEQAAALADTTLEEVEGSIAKMQKKLVEAQAGSKEAALGFKALGLNAAELANMGTADAFWKVADAINELPTGTDRAAAAMIAFGKSGQKMLTFLQTGSEGFKEAGAQAKRFGNSFSGADFQAVQAANDAMTSLGKSVSGFGRQLAISIAPGVQLAAEKLTELTVAMRGVGAPDQSDFNAWVHNFSVGTLEVAHLFEKGVLIMRRTWAEFVIDFKKGAAVWTGFVLGMDPLQTEFARDIPGAQAAREAIQQQIVELDKAKPAAQQVAEAHAKIAEEAKKAAEHTKETADQFGRMENFLKLSEKFNSPLDKFREELTDLRKAQKFAESLPAPKGFMGPPSPGNLLGQGLVAELDKLRSSLGLDKIPAGPGAIRQGSREALSLQTAFERDSKRQNPLNELRDLSKQSLVIGKQQADYQRAMVDALKKLADEDGFEW